MGVATCSHIETCAQLSDGSSGCANTLVRPLGLGHAPAEAGPSGELAGLSYLPPPPPDAAEAAESLLGTKLPQRPKSWATGAGHGGTTSGHWPLGSSTSRSDLEQQSCARPGEPVNKVYVQFSNDLEGFLPYTLVISEEMGLEFNSLSHHPDCALNPLNVIRINKLSYEDLMQDAFFTSLSKSVLARPELWPGGKFPASPPHVLARNLEERVRPPYHFLVQLSVRRPLLEGGQVIVFIAVQCDALGSELIRSCEQLRRRRAFRPRPAEACQRETDATVDHTALGPSRGFPTTAAPPYARVAASGSVSSTSNPTEPKNSKEPGPV